MRSYNPPVQAPGFGLFRFRSPLLSESHLISLPPGTEMVHFPGFARTRLYIQRAVSQVHWDGFPHSEIPGSKPACGSPRLIAACHVLHRLLAPRHPPYALSSLTIKLTQHVAAGNTESPAHHRPSCQLSRHFFLPHTRYLQNLRCTPLRLNTRRRGVCQLPSVFKERLPRSGRGADFGFSRFSEQQKNRHRAPGQSVHSPFTSGGDGFTRSSIFFYPVFETKPTSQV